MAFEEFSNLHGVSRMFFHTQSQCLHAAGDEECIKRAEYRTRHIFDTEETYVVDVFLSTNYEAGNNVAMAVQIFSSRMNNYVSTKG